jgi:hypothetical protein
LVKSEIGLIISSHVHVNPEGQAGPRQIAIRDDHFIVAFPGSGLLGNGECSVIMRAAVHGA